MNKLNRKNPEFLSRGMWLSEMLLLYSSGVLVDLTERHSLWDGWRWLWDSRPLRLNPFYRPRETTGATGVWEWKSSGALLNKILHFCTTFSNKTTLFFLNSCMNNNYFHIFIIFKISSPSFIHPAHLSHRLLLHIFSLRPICNLVKLYKNNSKQIINWISVWDGLKLL